MKNSHRRVVVFAALAGANLADAAVRLRHSKLRHQSHLKSEESAESRAETMEALFPFYHTTDQISDELKRLAGSCPGLSLQSVGPDNSIDVVTIRAPGSSPVNKNFLLFGEHSRELISPESGLHLLRSLCGETELSQQAQSVLQDSEFQIVVNGNPGSRRKVETGDFCLRVNPHGVDLNRNWDEEWSPGAVLDPADTNPGPKAFSEPETQAFKQLVEEYRPSTFLTIHSGTKGMYMPWAYDMEHLAQRNQPQMMQILKGLDAKYCECPFGAAGREVGYSCPGTCLDYVYDKLQTSYAFAFEIYCGSDYADDLKSRWEEKISGDNAQFIQLTSNLAHEHFKDIFEDHPSSFVQVRSQNRHFGRSAVDCFQQFNPSDESEYKQVLENWSAAYLEMAAMVAKNLRAGNATSTATV